MKIILNLVLTLFITVLASTAYADSDNPFSNDQIWKGSYNCAQGKTALTLRIKNASPSLVKTDLGNAYKVEAVFDFDFNNRSAVGAFYLTGAYYPESHVATFDPAQWIRRPPGYNTVGMDGKVSNDGQTYTGKILFQGCKLFQLQLVN